MIPENMTLFVEHHICYSADLRGKKCFHSCSPNMIFNNGGVWFGLVFYVGLQCNMSC